MPTHPYFERKLKQIEVGRKGIAALLDEMAQTGFQGRRLGEAFDVWREMLTTDDLTIYLGYAGSMSTTGMWKIICWLIENRFVDVLVSTGANVSEDLLEALGGNYWQGSAEVNDADLFEHKIDRFYDVYVDEMEYRRMEEFVERFAHELEPNRPYSSREFLYLFGKKLADMNIRCILSTAYQHGVPVFCPAMVDSGYGIALTLARRDGHHVVIDGVKDADEFTRVAERAKETGVIYLGGGVPKNFTQQVAVVLSLLGTEAADRPHRYAVQLTTDSPQWGGLSGCTFDEAVSWGKIAVEGRHVACYCDTTIALPIIVHALHETVPRRKRHPTFDWLVRGDEMSATVRRTRGARA